MIVFISRSSGAVCIMACLSLLEYTMRLLSIILYENIEIQISGYS